MGMPLTAATNYEVMLPSIRDRGLRPETRRSSPIRKNIHFYY